MGAGQAAEGGSGSGVGVMEGMGGGVAVGWGVFDGVTEGVVVAVASLLAVAGGWMAGAVVRTRCGSAAGDGRATNGPDGDGVAVATGTSDGALGGLAEAVARRRGVSVIATRPTAVGASVGSGRLTGRSRTQARKKIPKNKIQGKIECRRATFQNQPSGRPGKIIQPYQAKVRKGPLTNSSLITHCSSLITH